MGMLSSYPANPEYVALPPHSAAGFGHGDVHAAVDRVFVAHTANDTLHVIDADHLELLHTVAGSPKAAGVMQPRRRRAISR